MKPDFMLGICALVVNPVTGKHAMPAKDMPGLPAIMAVVGFYDASGDWMYDAPLLARTGVGVYRPNPE